MTNAGLTLSYATPHTGNCPLCHQRQVWKKSIYNTPVCKKCFYAFANRRQLGYLIDALIWIVPALAVNFPLVALLSQTGLDELAQTAIVVVVDAGLACVFIMKDGFGGQSPGKRLMGVQALDERTGQPVGFAQSFKRNAIILVGQIPVVGGLVGLVVLLILAYQVAGGYRLGDRFAQTRVIWKKYADSPVFGGKGLICEACGYNLHGNVSGVCPECGTAVSQRNAAQLAGSV